MTKTRRAGKTDSELNPKQRAFVTEYLVDGNATQAAIRAGYSKKTAEQLGYRLLRNVQIRAAIEAGRKSLDKATIADATERREVLTGMFRDVEGQPLARLKAADIMNKMDGLYVTKHAGPDGGPIPLGGELVIRRVLVRPDGSETTV